jgi:hypothetical protein
MTKLSNNNPVFLNKPFTMKQILNDTIVYDLFNDKQKENLSITGRNENFWMSRQEMQDLSDNFNFDYMFIDTLLMNNNPNALMLTGERKVYIELLTAELSDDAAEVLEMARELTRSSMKYRQKYHEENFSLRLDKWDAGYLSLKPLWQKYFSIEFLKFRLKYIEFKRELEQFIIGRSN